MAMVVCSEQLQESLAACEETLQELRAFLPALPPEQVILDLRLRAASLLGRLNLEMVQGQLHEVSAGTPGGHWWERETKETT
jgi:hypothetical protein